MNIRSMESQELLYELSILMKRLDYLAESRRFTLNKINGFKFAGFASDDYSLKDYSQRNEDLKKEIFETLDKIEIIIKEFNKL